jgi:hypothetical protein
MTGVATTDVFFMSAVTVRTRHPPALSVQKQAQSGLSRLWLKDLLMMSLPQNC